ncbi:MAG: hypothetical protein IT355_13850 [Gemmatimonadaceae bacterium]|nr:hypothetical protein [Gemmatimonadaceae bacterium]
MHRIIDTLAESPLLLLFATVAVGYPIGRLRFRGVRFGVAAILFAGLTIGALDERLRLPEVVQQLGLCLFVYSVGLASGPGFLATLRRHGIRNGAVVLVALFAAAGATWIASHLLGLSTGMTGGLFSGSVTNTPALAAVLESLRGQGMTSALEQAGPVVAHSVAYPLGVLIPMIAIGVVPRLWRGEKPSDIRTSQSWPASSRGRAGSGSLIVGTIEVTRADAVGVPLEQLRHDAAARVQHGRVKRVDGTVELATSTTVLALGDLVTAVGESKEVSKLVERLGTRSVEAINLDRRELDVRRIFVSNTRVVGHSLRELDLMQQYGATITAIRRGDADWIPDGDTVLQLGDRVRVLTRRENLQAVSAFLGDSYRAVSEFDVLTFAFGIVLGVAAGMVPIPLPGGITVRLGLAGGPLVVAMVLGARGRTGPFVWGIPYGVSLTMRQLGLLLFFAGIGTRSGFASLQALHDPATLGLLGGGLFVTSVTSLSIMLSGRYLFGIPEGILTGVIAGIHTQPAALSAALEQRLDETPNVGYAAVFPLATVVKLILAQVLTRL